MNHYIRHFVAEAVGVFALVFIGSGAIMMAQRTNSSAGLITVALAHGLVFALMVSSTMSVSGGHINPAVTIGLLVARRIAPAMAGVHIIAQLLGGVLGALALKGLIPMETFNAVRGGAQSVDLDITMGQAIGLEAIATFFLMFVVYGTTVVAEVPRLAGMAIGLTIAADIMAIGPLTGGSMNPARSFGPAFATGVWEGQVVFWIGPILGAILAALLWEFVLMPKRGKA